MGTFAKRLGQLAARGLETEGANILKTTKANKVPGSLAASLDRTLKTGHDMKTFGLGTAASMANRERYGRFTRSMFQAVQRPPPSPSAASSLSMGDDPFSPAAEPTTT